MLEQKLKNLVLDVYDLPVGKECSDFLQDIMLLVDNLQSLNNKLLWKSKRIDSLIENLCNTIQSLCDDYRKKRINKDNFCEEYAKLAFIALDKVLLMSVELLSKIEMDRIKQMKKRVHSLKVRRQKSNSMKSLKKLQTAEMRKMKIIYDSLSDEDKDRPCHAIYSMTKKYKDKYKEDCYRSNKTMERWIREWKKGS